MRLVKISARDASGTETPEAACDDELQAALFAILEANVLCSISTVTPNRQAHINTAYFSYSDELEVYFLSHPHSTHSRNLEENHSMAMAIFSSAQTWASCDVGAQLFGTCALPEGADAKRAEELYAKRFAFYASWKETRSGVGAEYELYRFEVDSVKVLDDARFGDGIIVSASIQRT